MRWKKKTKRELGQERTKIKFAWFPTNIDETTIWLERYKSKEVWCVVTKFTPSHGYDYTFLAWKTKQLELL